MKLIFLCICAFLALTLLATGSDSQPLPLPVLPYSYNAYAPVLSEEAMRLHHLGHHQTYTDKLNAALTQLRTRGDSGKELAKLGIDTLLSRLAEVPEDLRTAIKNNGGGYVNHDLYFKCLSPPSPNGTDGSAPAPREPAKDSNIRRAIEKEFGSFAEFQTKFTDAATNAFGSAWVFLYVHVEGANKSLRLRTTANQENPTQLDSNPHHVHLLTIDIWEHAYYVNYQNRRVAFIKGFWEIVNWNAVETLYSSFLTYDKIRSERDL